MSSIGLRAAVSQTMSNLTLTRRKALQMFAAQMALTVAGCSKPNEEIVPYVQMPEGLIPGEPLRFATALPIDGYGQGILAISVDGRPIKVEGNPRHPASLGATDAFAEAAILTLYDPDRSRTPTENGAIASWDAFRAALLPQLEHHDRTAGEGLRLVTGRITSPTLLRQIDSLLTRYPLARWHVHEPIDDRMERRGDVLAFGRAVHHLLHLDRVAVMLCLDADPLGPGPTQVRNARQWIQSRNSKDTQQFLTSLRCRKRSDTYRHKGRLSSGCRIQPRFPTSQSRSPTCWMPAFRTPHYHRTWRVSQKHRRMTFLHIRARRLF